MRDILEDAAIIYRQEAESLLIIVAPAIVLGPILAMISASGLMPALVTVPVFLLLYLAAYAACVRAAGFVLDNQEPEPGSAYLGVLSSALEVIRAAAPGGFLLAVAWASALVLIGLGFPLLALAIGLLGTAAAFPWASRHAYDQPLILVHEVRAVEAVRVGSHFAEAFKSWTMILLAVVSLPLLAAVLLSWGLAAAVTPSFGGAVFALALALWLPFSALSLTGACARLVGAADASAPDVPAEATG